MSDSKTRLLSGGWVREQVITDLPASKTIAGAQQHLTKGSYRELHWHRVAEWGYLYEGELLLSAVDENGENQVEKLQKGDIWYFPKGRAHGLQGLGDQNEYLLVFDDGNFDATGTTFMVDDWIAHTPRSILAQNFGLNESVFDSVPKSDPYSKSRIRPSAPATPPDLVAVLKGKINSTEQTASPYGKLQGNSSYVYHLSQHQPKQVAGGGGSISIVDSTNFPIATTIASAVVTLKPGALRELHWHPNVSSLIRR